MGVRILSNAEDDMAVLYCSTTDWAFGPVFNSWNQAQAFLVWLEANDGRDARKLTDGELQDAHSKFLETYREDGEDEEDDGSEE